MAEDQNEWYRFKAADEIDTPALVFYPDRIRENMERLKYMVSSPDMLRPHVKTHKSADVTKLMILNGINKFKCATITEAEMLGGCGAKDVLLAYQPTYQKLRRLFNLMETYPNTRFSCLVDNLVSANMISDLALEAKTRIEIYIDLNVGMNRTGIRPDAAFDLFMDIIEMKGIGLLGFHAYDGHIKEVGLSERTVQCNAAFEPVEVLREKIKAKGFPYPLLIAGGSPTFQIHSTRQHVECSPGTFILWDKGYRDTIPEQDFLFAALVISRVISLPASNKICIDLGYKAISSENDLLRRAWFLDAPYLKPYSHSEEHMVIEAGEGHNYKIGDLFYVVPVHICPTVALYNQAHLVTDQETDKTWSVNARDHELLR
ncbi:MAG: D-TA family PLP-dependent enzyme [Flavobacterium sp.]|nr:MAG: D-TA family PLP-dependent enzyme [Flavobacterium sp.]